MQPVFLLSLPRSGSTYLQSLLGCHPEIATAPEPWILLGSGFSLRKEGHLTDYGHQAYIGAVKEFGERLPGGLRRYREILGTAACALYGEAATGRETFFLDKTPRYHLIVGELAEMFPNAPFVVLRRNPLAVAASIARRWCGDRWRLHNYEVDIYGGLSTLAEVETLLGERVYSIRYEDLVKAPDHWVSRVHQWLGLDPVVGEDAERYVHRASGRYGDRWGAIVDGSVEIGRAEEWRKCYCNVLRRRWAKRYLEWIGGNRLSMMGYEKGVLLGSLERNREVFRRLPADLIAAIKEWRQRQIEKRFSSARGLGVDLGVSGYRLQ